MAVALSSLKRQGKPDYSILSSWIYGKDLHSAEGDVDCGASQLDGDNGVEGADSGLEWLEEAVLVREHAILPGLDTKTDACVDILCGRLEPGVTLRLQ